jgi:hypothetical protein
MIARAPPAPGFQCGTLSRPTIFGLVTPAIPTEDRGDGTQELGSAGGPTGRPTWRR